MPKFRPIAEIEKEEAAKGATLSLIDNDRPFSELEEEAEAKADRYSRFKYPRVNPIPGTLGFLLRNLRGGNEAVIEFLRNAVKTNNAKFAKNFVTLWNNMDEFSRKRVDIFDILCNKYSVPRKKFWGVIQEGMFENNDALSQIALSGHKAEFVELLKKMARLPKNHNDRKLLAEAMGITKETPLISITDNSKHETVNVQVNNNNLPSFASSIKRSEKIVQENLQLKKEEPLALTEGKQDYIDTEWTKVKEEDRSFLLGSIENENNLVISQVEKQLKESAKEL